VEIVLVVAVLVVAVLVIIGPLRPSPAATGQATPQGQRAELEAAKEAKLREIRDAELDYRTGKLSHDDWRVLDSGLRAEAIELLHRLDALEAKEGGEESERGGR